MRNLAINHQSVDALTPYAQNARTHSKNQIRQIADSIKTFGWTNPVLVDNAGGVIAGQGRIEAAKLLGIDECGRNHSARRCAADRRTRNRPAPSPRRC